MTPNFWPWDLDLPGQQCPRFPESVKGIPTPGDSGPCGVSQENEKKVYAGRLEGGSWGHRAAWASGLGS